MAPLSSRDIVATRWEAHYVGVVLVSFDAKMILGCYKLKCVTANDNIGAGSDFHIDDICITGKKRCGDL